MYTTCLHREGERKREKEEAIVFSRRIINQKTALLLITNLGPNYRQTSVMLPDMSRTCLLNYLVLSFKLGNYVGNQGRNIKMFV